MMDLRKKPQSHDLVTKLYATEVIYHLGIYICSRPFLDEMACNSHIIYGPTSSCRFVPSLQGVLHSTAALKKLKDAHEHALDASFRSDCVVDFESIETFIYDRR